MKIRRTTATGEPLEDWHEPEEDDYFHCCFCSFKSTVLHEVSNHMCENHPEKLETDYDPLLKNFTYMKIKQ